jgi:hypothetical protein
MKMTLLRAVPLMLAAAAGGVGAAELRATLERNPVHAGESVHLVVELDKAAGGQRPELAPLRADFQVLGSEANTQIEFIHGKQSATTRWRVELMPRREGALTIPALTLGKLESAPLTLQVLPARQGGGMADGDIFLEAELTPDPAYVQAQMIFTVRLLRAVDVVDGSLTEPAVGNATIRRLGRDIGYTTDRDGRQYRVLERRYAVFPQTSGQVTVSPVSFEGEVVDPGQAGSGIARLFQRGRRVRLRTEAIDARVRPPPPDFPAQVWLPARALDLKEQWSRDPASLRAGEPVTRTLSLHGEGLGAEQLPELATWPVNGIKEYGDQPITRTTTDNASVHGIREQRIALVPGAEGSYRLPEIRIPWWDTDSDSLREAIIPARTLKVAPATRSVAPPPLATVGSALGTGHENVARWWRWAPLWQGLCAGLLALWLGTLLAWHRSRRTAADGHDRASSRARRPIVGVDALERACHGDDAPGARRALLQWAAMLWPEDPPCTLTVLGERVGDRALGQELDELDRALYARRAQPWQGVTLWRQVRRAMPPRPAPGRNDRDRLAPLYPRR